MTYAAINNSNAFQCPYCGMVSHIVWVHGHGQCDRCKINVDECCRGEDATCRLETELEHTHKQ